MAVSLPGVEVDFGKYGKSMGFFFPCIKKDHSLTQLGIPPKRAVI